MRLSTQIGCTWRVRVLRRLLTLLCDCRRRVVNSTAATGQALSTIDDNSADVLRKVLEKSDALGGLVSRGIQSVTGSIVVTQRFPGFARWSTHAPKAECKRDGDTRALARCPPGRFLPLTAAHRPGERHFLVIPRRALPVRPVCMRTIKVIATALLAFPIVPASTAGDARHARKLVNQNDAAAIEARRQCFLEAQAQVPGAAIGGEEMSQRTSICTSCAQRKGVRP